MNNLMKDDEVQSTKTIVQPIVSNKLSREEVWIRAWCTVAGCIGVKHVEVPNDWARECLKAFDEAFPNA